jgi:hypothetical protein
MDGLMKIRLATTENEARYHHYRDVVEDPLFEWVGTVEGPFDEASLGDIDGLIVSCEHHWPSRLAIAACKRLGIPTFHVLDGIVEWRNLFENPRTADPSSGAPLFQPLLSDVTFAMGSVQKRALEWLGNDRVLATGFPRLDALDPRPCRTGTPAGTPRILVATANTPWFTPAQQDLFLREFSDLAQRLRGASIPGLFARTVSWRVAASVAEALGIANDLSGSATEALRGCDALITTPSSLAVEAMLLGIPTLIFDPYACPIFTPVAWHATSAGGVLTLLSSLIAPEGRRAALQDALLRFIAPVDRGSAERIRRVIHGVVSRGGIPEGAEEGMDTVGRIPEHMPQAVFSESEIGDLRALAASIPMLDRILAEKQRTIDELHRERERPTLRHALGCLYRSVMSFRAI